MASFEDTNYDATEPLIDRSEAEYDSATIPAIDARQMQQLSDQLDMLYEEGLENDQIRDRFQSILVENGVITGDGDTDQKVVRLVNQDGSSSVEMIVTSYHDFGTTLRGVTLHPKNAEATPENAEATDRFKAALELYFESQDLSAAVESASAITTSNIAIMQLLDHAENTLASANYNGGHIDGGFMLQFLSDLRGMNGSAKVMADELADVGRRIETSTDELADDSRHTSPGEDTLYQLRKLEEGAAELRSTTGAASAEYAEIETVLTPYGKFESDIEELIRTTQGYEFTISSIRARINEMQDALHRIQGRLLRVGDTVDDMKKAG